MSSTRLSGSTRELSQTALTGTCSGVPLSRSTEDIVEGTPMRAELRELYRYRELLVMIAIRDIKVRYKQSLMGFLWAILMPLLIVSAGILVRYAYAIASHKPLDTQDILAVAMKSVPWAFLVASIRFSCQSLLINPNLVTK